jgi:hypothetical protein
MSIHVTLRVWDQTPTVKGGDLLTLLALSEFADESGRCWPSVKTLATRCRLTKRQVQRVLRRLEKAGHLNRQPQAGRAGVNIYTVLCASSGVTQLPPGDDKQGIGEMTPIPSEPSRNRHQESESKLSGYPTVKEAEEFAFSKKWPVDAVTAWHSNRESQGWIKGNGNRVTNWRADLDAWIIRNTRGRPEGKTKLKPIRHSKFANGVF